MVTEADINGLGRPAVIEALDYEAILTALMADANARFVAAGIDYNVGALETDPVKIVLEAAAYREMLIRARVNDAAAANLIAYATGTDLDHLAAFYDVVRLTGETDVALRARTILAIVARSPGGSAFHYENAARRADVRIRDVAVYKEEFWPIVHIAVLSSINGGVADQEMLDAVTAEVTSDQVRLVNDTIVVEGAVSQTVDIVGNVYLLPDTALSVFSGLEATVRAAWDAEAGIGFDLATTWIMARLHVPGVKRVELVSPIASVVPADNGAIALGTITLTMAGREF